MKKLFTKVAIAVAGFTGVAVAQQDPQFTQFMYNKLIYNPGYAGTSGAICAVGQYRQQWAGFDGNPKTIAVAGDMPLKGLPVGVGFNVMSDKVGPMNTVYARLAGSYNINVSRGKLGLGLDFGIMQKHISTDWITPEGPIGRIDPRIPTNTADLNKVSYDVGVGAFYQIPGQFYIGLSSTHLPAQELSADAGMAYRVSRHYYGMVGYTFRVTPWSKLTPNILYKTDIASTSIDANLTYMLFDKFWVGGTYRHDDAAAAMLGVQMPFLSGNSGMFKIGYSYDFSLTEMKKYSGGSHEIILGVCYTPKIIKPTTHLNDRYLD